MSKLRCRRYSDASDDYYCSYGGPGTQTVSSAWSVGWDTYLASMRDFIVCSVDVRGSGYQGDDIKHSVSYQVTDTLHVIRYIIILAIVLYRQWSS